MAVGLSEHSVIKKFVDKLTGQYYREGDKYTCSEQTRIMELQAAGFISVPPPVSVELETAVLSPEEEAKLPKKIGKRVV